MRTHFRAWLVVSLWLSLVLSAPAQTPGGGMLTMEQAMANTSRVLGNVRAHPAAKADALVRLQDRMTGRGITDSAARLAEIGKIFDEAIAMKPADFAQNQAQLVNRIMEQMRPGGAGAGAPPDAAAMTPAAGGPATAPVKAIPWIDVHVHFVTGMQADYAGAAGAALALMDKNGIRRMIIMPPPEDGSSIRYDCDAFGSTLLRQAGRFSFMGGGGSLNIMLQQAAGQTVVTESLRRQFEQKAESILRLGAVGFGEMTVHHLSHTTGHPYESVAPDHPLLLLLADIAARHDVPIDIHCDVVAEEITAPDWLTVPPNPRVFHANLAAFERLLAHNPKAKISWAHAGSDMLGFWTTDLSRRLLQQYPNLFMSLRLGMPGHAAQNSPLDFNGQLRPEWLALLQEFPTRFVIGGDHFIVAPQVHGTGPGLLFAKKTPFALQQTKVFLNALPADLAQKIACDNAVALYKLPKTQ